MNATIDPELVTTIQECISKLSSDVNERAIESKEQMDRLRILDSAIERIEWIEQKLCSTDTEVDQLKTNVDELQQRVAKLENQPKSGVSGLAHGNVNYVF